MGMHTTAEVNDGFKLVACICTSRVVSSNCLHSNGSQLGGLIWHLALTQSQKPELAADVDLWLVGAGRDSGGCFLALMQPEARAGCW